MKKLNQLSSTVLNLLSLSPDTEIDEEQLKQMARDKVSELLKSDEAIHTAVLIELCEIFKDIVVF